ncbi:MAG TPA: VWA domain-containing protein [Pyrinomonadaceae bacterium]
MGICALISGAAPMNGAAAQEKTRQKDFGSSLGRLRWDPSKQAAAEVGGGGAGAGADEGEEVVRVEASLAVCDVLVADAKGRAVRGLTRDDFVVTEEGRPLPVSTFAPGDERGRPRFIVLVIDYSGSQRPYLEKSIEAAKTLVEQLGPADRMAVVTDDVALLADFTQDRKALKRALDSLADYAESGAPPGRSRQYSALLATANELLQGKERPIVIFQTDGDELAALRQKRGAPPADPARGSREFSLVDVITAVEKAHATVYSVVPSIRIVGLPPDAQVERAKATLANVMRPQSGASVPAEFFNRYVESLLKQQTALEGLSKLTGGWAEFLETPEQAGGIYARILSDINRRYVIGFRPPDTARDGKRHRVGIEVRGHPEYTVWGRKSYYAPGPPE